MLRARAPRRGAPPPPCPPPPPPKPPPTTTQTLTHPTSSSCRTAPRRGCPASGLAPLLLPPGSATPSARAAAGEVGAVLLSSCKQPCFVAPPCAHTHAPPTPAPPGQTTLACSPPSPPQPPPSPAHRHLCRGHCRLRQVVGLVLGQQHPRAAGDVRRKARQPPPPPGLGNKFHASGGGGSAGARPGLHPPIVPARMGVCGCAWRVG